MTFKFSYFYFFAFFILFFAVSCEKQFNTIVEVDIPELDNQIVINCIFNDTSTFQVNVYRSRSSLNEDLSTLSFINNATVDLFADGNYLETLSLREEIFEEQDMIFNYYESINKAIPNVVYTLEVSAPDLPTAKATAQLPQKATINSASITDTIFWQNDIPEIENDIQRYGVSLNFQDIANTDNYYYLKNNVRYDVDIESILAQLDIWRQTNPDTLFGIEDYVYALANQDNTYELCLYTSDASFEETKAYSDFEFELEGNENQNICYYGINIFSDRLFKDEMKELDVQVEYVYGGLDAYFPNDFQTQYVMELGTVSEDMFLYQRSAQLQYNNQNNFFAEPVRVYNNVENGFGIFAAYNISTYIVE